MTGERSAAAAEPPLPYRCEPRPARASPPRSLPPASQPAHLAGAGRGHGREQQAVAHAVRLDVGAQAVPVPALGGHAHAPHVVLQDALGHGAALVRGVGAVLLGQGAAGLLGGRAGGGFQR